MLQGKILMTHPTKAITWSLLSDFVKVSRNSVDEGLYTEQARCVPCLVLIRHSFGHRLCHGHLYAFYVFDNESWVRVMIG